MFWEGSASDFDGSDAGCNNDRGVGYNNIDDYRIFPWPSYIDLVGSLQCNILGCVVALLWMVLEMEIIG